MERMPMRTTQPYAHTSNLVLSLHQGSQQCVGKCWEIWGRNYVSYGLYYRDYYGKILESRYAEAFPPPPSSSSFSQGWETGV